jgi:APA family basic amino acid/polyamine antiporter
LLIVVVFAVAADPKQAFDGLTDFVVLGTTIFCGLTVAAVFVLRKQMPDVERPYRTWGYPLTPAVFLLSVGVVVWTGVTNNPWQMLSVTGLLAVGFAAYRWFGRAAAP